MTDDEIVIDVRYEPEIEAVAMNGTRPVLAWCEHPRYGSGWCLTYADDPDAAAWQVEEHFVGGDLLDVDHAVRQARSYLHHLYTTPKH